MPIWQNSKASMKSCRARVEQVGYAMSHITASTQHKLCDWTRYHWDSCTDDVDADPDANTDTDNDNDHAGKA